MPIKTTFERSLLLSVILICLLSSPANAQMQMHVINVGQAEAILLEFPHHAILVDAGSHLDDTREHFFSYLDAFFARRADLNGTLHSVVVSHPHPDHTTNLKAVFERYRVQHFIEGGDPANSGVKAARALLAAEPAEHHIILAKDVKKASFMRAWRNELMTGSEANVRFLSAGRSCNDANNASLVMRVEYKGRSFLLLGDAEEDDKKGANVGCGGLLYRLLDKTAAFPSLLNVDVYKVAHHGARNGTIDVLLAKAKPAYVVISAGDNTRNQSAGNFSAWDHGHPNSDSVIRLETRTQKKREIKTVTVMSKQESPVISRSITKAIYCTGWDGDIVFSVDAAGVLAPPVFTD